MTDQQHEPVAAELVDTRTGEVLDAPAPGNAIELRDNDTPRRSRAELAMMDRGTDSWTVVVEDVGVLANRIAWTEFVPKSFRGKPAAVGAVILHGRELGLPPMTALALTHLVEGKPAVSAEGMRALVLQSGHELRFRNSDSTSCTLEGRRAGEHEWTGVTWSIADAQRAGLGRKAGPWQQYPRVMLQARATAELCRMIFPDVIHGLGVTEELEDLSSMADAPVSAAVAPAGPTTKVSRARPALPSRAEAAQAAADSIGQEIATGPGIGAEAAEEPRQAPPARSRVPRPARAPKAAAETPAASLGGDAAGPGEGKTTPTPAEAEGAGPAERPAPSTDEPTDEPAPDVDQLEPPAEDTLPVEEAAAPPRPITGPQRGAIFAECKRLQLDGDDEQSRIERLAYLQVMADREAPLTSSSDLTAAEASTVIERLKFCTDRDHLDSLVMGR